MLGPGVALSCLRGLTSLREIHLKGCYKVADPGLAALGRWSSFKPACCSKKVQNLEKALCRRLTSLTRLNLHECWQITAVGINSLSGVRAPCFSGELGEPCLV